MDLQEALSNPALRHLLFSERFDVYATSRLKVRDATRSVLTDFKLYPEQMYVYKQVKKLRDTQIPALMRIYKARKRGMSTFFVADMLHRFQYSGRVDWGEIYGHEKKASTNLFGILNTFYNNIPEDERWKKVRDSQTSLEFDNGTQIQIQTVGSKGESRSGSPNYILLTEVAKYSEVTDVISYLSGVLSGITFTPDTTIIMESTSKGHDPYWYQEYLASMELLKQLSRKHGITSTWEEELRGETLAYKLVMGGHWPYGEYVPVFIPWFWNTQNRFPALDETRETLTDYEKEIMLRYKLDIDQIQWRRNAKKAQCQGDEGLTRQEFPCSAEESFLASGRPVFDMEKLDKMRFKAERLVIGPTNDIKTLNLSFVEGKAPTEIAPGLYRNTWQMEVGAIPTKYGNWLEVTPPVPGWVNRYCAGIDTAEGLEQGDYDVGIMFDRYTRKFVAMYMDHMSFEEHAKLITMGATRYNYADILPERNNTGHGLLVALTPMYPNVMQNTRTSRGTDEVLATSAYGFDTKGPSKSRVIELLKDFVRQIPDDTDGSEIPFRELIIQMMTFVYTKKGGMEADGKTTNPGVKNFDDLVMAAALALEADRILSVQGLHPREKTKTMSQTLYTKLKRLPSRRCL